MARNLAAWDAISETSNRTIAVIGESNAQAFGVTIAENWPGVLRRSARWPSRGLGFRHLGFEWTSSGSPTRHDASATYNKGPYRYGFRLNTSSQTYTYTVPAGHTAHSTSKLVYVDASGSGNWSFRINGGSWTASGAATAGDNGIKTVEIGTTVDAAGTIEVRGANAAGTNVQLDLLGIDLRNGTSTGLLVHNVAFAAHKLTGGLIAGVFESFVHSTSGDDLAILDYLDPDVCVCWFVSDAILEDIPTFRSGVQEVIDRVHGNGGKMVLPKYPEIEGSGFTSQNQSDLNAAYLAEAAENSTAYVDVHAAFGGSAAAGQGLGYFQGGDNAHFSATGHARVAASMWRLLGGNKRLHTT